MVIASHSRHISLSNWEIVLPEALHSIRSLLCTATNATPHERLFLYQRRSSSGLSIPSWLTKSGPVLMKRHVRHPKYEPLVDKVELVEANPNYAHVRLSDGREATVSVDNLAPYHLDLEIEADSGNVPIQVLEHETILNTSDCRRPEDGTSVTHPNIEESSVTEESLDASPSDNQGPRRSTRIRRAPERLVL